MRLQMMRVRSSARCSKNDIFAPSASLVTRLSDSPLMDEMSELADAAPGGEALSNGPGDVGLGVADRVAEGLSPREAGGDRRRERAAGAVGVARLDPGCAERRECLAVPQEIEGVALQVTALHQDVARAEPVDAPRRLLHLGPVADRHACEHLRLGKI